MDFEQIKEEIWRLSSLFRKFDTIELTLLWCAKM